MLSGAYSEEVGRNMTYWTRFPQKHLAFTVPTPKLSWSFYSFPPCLSVCKIIHDETLLLTSITVSGTNYFLPSKHNATLKAYRVDRQRLLATQRSRVAQSVQCLTTDGTAGVRSPTEAEGFSCSLCVQTGYGAHPAPCTMGTGGSFPGGKARPGRDADHSPPSSAEVKKEQELYLLSPECVSMERNGTTLPFFFLPRGIIFNPIVVPMLFPASEVALGQVSLDGWRDRLV
jgi:hypothetical protein